MGGFFDKPKVYKTMDPVRRKVMSKAGAYVRNSAKKSIRSRKGVSQPGSPPSNHEGTLKRLIFFAATPDNRNVVVGPLRRPGGTSRRPGPKRGASLLEFGGYVPGDHKIFIKDGITRRGEGGRFLKQKLVLLKVTGLRYKPRPFMAPALSVNRPKIVEMWKDSIR